ncbi:MAG TPA: hypothetical protein VGL72_22780 [Bryobacteraceae bacterium]|jgi:hypothetical protein
MAPIANYVYDNSQADRVMQLIIATAPLVLVFMMRMVLGRSKELILAVWLSVGWFAIRASLNPSMSFIRDCTRPIEHLITTRL